MRKTGKYGDSSSDQSGGRESDHSSYGVSDSFYDEGTASESVQTLDLPESVGISAYGSRGQKQKKFSGADESPQSLYFQGCVKEFPD